jgi:hypothetical protein
MHIRNGVFYQMATNKLVGFSEIDTSSLEGWLQSDSSERPSLAEGIADHYHVFYWKSMFHKFEFPVCHWATRGSNVHQVTRMVHSCLTKLQIWNFRTGAICKDGAIENRTFDKAMCTHSLADLNIACDPSLAQIKCAFRFGEDWVFSFSDPPHLIKKLRNSLEKSGVGTYHTRLLTFPEKFTADGAAVGAPVHAMWSTCVDIYRGVIEGPQLSSCRILSRECFFLTPFSRMRVSPAANLLGPKFIDCIDQYVCDVPTAKHETTGLRAYVDRCSHIHQFFMGDNLGGFQNNNFVQLRSPLAPELILLQLHVKWFCDWHHWCEELPEHAVSDCFIPPDKCFYDLKITAASMIGVVATYCHHNSSGLDIPPPCGGASYKPPSHVSTNKEPLFGWYIVPGKFNQDICEHHFQHTREASGSHSNPNMQHTNAAFNAAWAARMQVDSQARGNTASRVSGAQTLNIRTAAGARRWGRQVFGPAWDLPNSS